MSCSPVRREATPASARNFCRRTIIGKGRGQKEESESRATRPSAAGGVSLSVTLGLAQAGDTIAGLPLAAFLEDFDPLAPFEDVAFCAGGASGAQTAVL